VSLVLCTQETLNMFLGMGRPAWREARATLQKILSGSLSSAPFIYYPLRLLAFLFTDHTISMQFAKCQEKQTNSLFACWFQPGLISQPTVFSSHNKSAIAELISPETNQRTGRSYK